LVCASRAADGDDGGRLRADGRFGAAECLSRMTALGGGRRGGRWGVRRRRSGVGDAQNGARSHGDCGWCCGDSGAGPVGIAEMRRR
jgi:hypothetical protein